MQHATWGTLIVTLAVTTGPAGAQIVTDGSVGQLGRVDLGSGSATITDAHGQIAGDNLFHSFERFNVNAGSTARFTATRTDLKNVISRVTGTEASTINGNLTSEVQGANFWFVNPNGVTFGPGAVVSVPGALHVSTADEIRFADGQIFSARTSTASTLTMAEPRAFGFLGAAPPGQITVYGSTLSPAASADMSLSAGQIFLVGNAPTVYASGVDGTVRLATETGQGSFAANEPLQPNARSGGIAMIGGGDVFSGIFARTGAPNAVEIATGTFSIANASVIGMNTAAADGGADIRIGAAELSFFGVGQSAIFTGATSSLAAGKIDINAGSISLDGSSIFSAAAFGTRAGDIKIHANNITMTNAGIGSPSLSSGAPGITGNTQVTATETLTIQQGAAIISDTATSFAAGDISVKAGRLEMADGAAIAARSNGSGAGGAITIMAGDLILQQGAQITVSALNSGDAGTLNITAGTLNLTSGSRIFGGSYGAGDGGSMTVNARDLAVSSGGFISTGTFGSGRGGNLTVNASSSLTVNDGLIGGGSRSAADTADAGSVTITAGSLRLSNEGRIFNGTSPVIDSNGDLESLGAGDGGPIAVTVVGDLIIDGVANDEVTFTTGISSTANGRTTGRAGDVTVSADRISLSYTNPQTGLGADISSNTFGSGPAGNVTVNAKSNLMIDNGRIDASADSSYHSALAGSMNITAGSINIVNRGRIFNGAYGAGSGGSTRVEAGELTLSDRGFISAETFGRGRAGDLTVNATSSLIVNNGFIGASTASEFETADAGSVTITAGNLELRNEGRIFNGTSPVLDGDGDLLSLGAGDGGPITVEVAGSLVIDGLVNNKPKFSTGISSTANSNTTGRAGDVTVTANHITLRGSDPETGLGADISSSTFGTGAAGNLTVSALTSLTIDDGSIEASTDSAYKTADAGILKVTAGSIQLTNDGRIFNGSDGAGDGGPITIETGSIVIDGTFDHQPQSITGISSAANPGSTGRAGDIHLIADRIALSNADPSTVNGAQISSQTQGPGAGGNIRLEVRDLSVWQGGRISAESGGAGVGGTIAIERADRVGLSTNGEITATTRGSGASGGVSLATETLTISQGAVTSGTFGSGRGGRVDIVAGDLSLDGGRIDTSTEGSGAAGDIAVHARGQVSLANGSTVQSASLGSGDAGSVAMTLGGLLDIKASSIRSSVDSGPTRLPADARPRGGGIGVAGGELRLTEGGQITASNRVRGDAGSISIDAGNRLTLARGSIATTATDGSGGSVFVTAREVGLVNGGEISASNLVRGNAGSIDINAGDRLTLAGGSITTRAAEGTGGGIRAVARELNLTDGAAISAANVIRGEAGSISVAVDERVALARGSITTTANIGGGGSIGIDAREVRLGDGALISASNLVRGDAGSIRIAAVDRLTLSGSAITTEAADGGGGSIAIGAGAVDLMAGAGISARTFGTGAGGGIAIATESLRLANASVSSGASGSGRGGFVDITAGTLRLDAGSIDTSTGGAGAAGDVAVRARGQVILRGGSAFESASSGAGDAGTLLVHAGGALDLAASRIATTVSAGAPGLAASARPRGGSIDIAARDVRLADGASISASNASRGEAGSIRIDAGDRLTLAGSSITTEAVDGGGGQVDIRARELVRLRPGSLIASSVTGDATTTAGDITIDPEFVILEAGSAIRANATGGRGGNIRITADNLIVDAAATIDASAGPAGISGAVVTSTAAENASATLAIDPAVFLGADQRLAESCAASRASGPSSFGPAGPQGLPPSPDRPQPGFYDLAGEPADAAAPAGRVRLVTCGGGG